MPAPCPRRTVTDPRGLRLFVHLARIAAATADIGGLGHAGLRDDLRLLEVESDRVQPRQAVALALVDEVVSGLAAVVSGETQALLADARDDVRRPHPALRAVGGGHGRGEISAAG
ncbi:hypothetical protein [Nocardioides sp. AX2bis]|uniref:hypothetical protein n=1 Tax=Nocardioides sp. AX2bis TaxID=2653157 RepID=UPI0012F08860|nr:hypothetical protein [Nocardioides sp. AX2bis]VXB67753.1 hypothetical protein NOCARDAX2BIS_30070 [Nocardioides sp. AX2bis]